MNTTTEKQTLIQVEKLSKKFGKNLRRSLWLGAVDVFKSFLGFKIKSDELRDGEFWSLQNINFELKQGDMLGIIGQNGSGKSTLLRILTGIYPPDAGSVTVRGRIGALISVGAGFHPHLSGLENIFLNATILGLSKVEVEKKLKDIIQFAEIGDFINSPVSTYSSGMTVRLGFSIAIHAVPEILLADEILAVGDLQFTLKCYRKLSEYRKNGGTIILVSHSLQQIRNFCNKALWIDKSIIKSYGDTKEVCDAYESFMVSKDHRNIQQENSNNKILNYDKNVSIKSVNFLNQLNDPIKTIDYGESLSIEIIILSKRVVNGLIVTFSIINAENVRVISNYNNFDGFPIDSFEGEKSIIIKFKSINLAVGNYTLTITISEDNDINKILVWHERMYTLKIKSSDNTFYGIFNPEPEWLTKDKK